jgi:hypothetical protein
MTGGTNALFRGPYDKTKGEGRLEVRRPSSID